MCAWSCNSCAYGTFYTTHLSNILQFVHTLRGNSPRRSLVIAPHTKSKQESGTDTDWVTQNANLTHKVRTHLPNLTNYEFFLVIYTQSFVKSKCKNHVHVYVWFSDVALTLFTCHGQQRGNWRQRSSLYSFSVVDWSQLTLSRRILGFIFFE